jgi:hypothetical protein
MIEFVEIKSLGAFRGGYSTHMSKHRQNGIFTCERSKMRVASRHGRVPKSYR